MRGRLTKRHPHESRGPLSASTVSPTGWHNSRWISALHCCLLAELLGWCPGSSAAANGKKQIFVFALRACGAIPALFTRTGWWPLTYYLVLAFLSLSQSDLHHEVLSLDLFYVHTLWLHISAVVSEDNVRCALRYALDSMQRDLWCTKAQKFFIAVFKKTVYFYYLFSALLSQW